ncbi:hypothetical protein ONV78_08350 [Hahella sp. CR1]|uniref:hypothetical protein n=1 Tax=Hahella sp. CR1 TaxID=2992807 RepID=UPI002442877C|nr:hypothetical protein [Hahella sp. CR1]MDG9667738.1 hypothetical protein [Hahella sp. CR1]
MTQIALIPVIEILYPAEAKEAEKPVPNGSWQAAPEAWDVYLRRLNRRMGFSDLRSFPPGSRRYPVADLTQADIALAIDLHLGDTPLQESCGLFGGLVLMEGATPILIPQCCGMLADITSWEALTRPEAFAEPFCLEGHPCPQAMSDSVEVEIQCVEDREPFEMPAPLSYRVSRQSLCDALEEAKRVLNRFAAKVEIWGRERGYPEAADVLVYEK